MSGGEARSINSGLAWSMQPRREQRQMVTTAAREEGMLVVSEGGSLFHMDLSMVADGNSTIEHNLPQSMLYDDVLQFWGQTNVAD